MTQDGFQVGGMVDALRDFHSSTSPARCSFSYVPAWRVNQLLLQVTFLCTNAYTHSNCVSAWRVHRLSLHVILPCPHARQLHKSSILCLHHMAIPPCVRNRELRVPLLTPYCPASLHTKSSDCVSSCLRHNALPPCLHVFMCVLLLMVLYLESVHAN